MDYVLFDFGYLGGHGHDDLERLINEAEKQAISNLTKLVELLVKTEDDDRLGVLKDSVIRLFTKAHRARFRGEPMETE